MACGIRATCNHRSWHSHVTDITPLSCPAHAKHGRRLDRRRNRTQYYQHGPNEPDDSRSQFYEDPTPPLTRNLSSHSHNPVPCKSHLDKRVRLARELTRRNRMYNQAYGKPSKLARIQRPRKYGHRYHLRHCAVEPCTVSMS
jgi:hypothetical protein